MNKVARAWIGLLGVAVIFYGSIVYKKTSQFDEYPIGCDAFGYLSMAKDFRETRHSIKWPSFFIQDVKTQELVQLMESLNIPINHWDELVAPHAHHFMPLTHQVAPQYPPGTGWVLSFFPEGHAVEGVNKVTLLLACFSAILAFVFAIQNSVWFGAGMVGILTYWILECVHDSSGSYSINVILLPLILSCVLLVLRKKSDLAQFIAGCLLGFSVLVRVPALFLWPGMMLLSWDCQVVKRSLWRSFCSNFNLGFIFCGIIPLAIHQYKVTGAWYLSTYSSGDNSLPDWKNIIANFGFYLGRGPGSGDNWLILDVLLGAIGIWNLTRKKDLKKHEVKEYRWMYLSAFIVWAVPLIYFLTHRVLAKYYLVPGILTATCIVVLTALKEDAQRAKGMALPSIKNRMSILWLVLALVPGFDTLNHVWKMRKEWSAPSLPLSQPLKVPEELRDPRAWIWADMTSGTFWYYGKKAAFKLVFSTPETREKIFQNLRLKGDPQFIINDSPVSEALMKEVQNLGAHIELRGEVIGKSYYRLDWNH